MEKVRIALYTPLPGFANDLCDVLKLFFEVEAFAVNPEGADGEPLRHEYQERGGVARSVMELRGQTFALEQALPQAAPGGDGEHLAVALKRVRKRLCKLSLYRLLRQLTGAHPPWGALTGIRPTRLLCQAMEEGRSMEEAQRHLEAFFDVTPEKAALLARIVREQQKLPAPCPSQADVYVSIPFCRTRCAYCSFPGEAVGRGGRIAPYLEALFWEMREGARLMERCGLSLRALYVGGGTPSALGEEDFARLMDEVMTLFPGAREYTVEAGRPDTITRGKLLALRRLGIGRISINPQTMNDETLRLIGRDHTARQTCEAFAMARELGFDDINMDVIAGLPGEDEAAFARTMAAVRRLAPDSLTVHTLAIKRSSRLNLERAPLPDRRRGRRHGAPGRGDGRCAGSGSVLPLPAEVYGRAAAERGLRPPRRGVPVQCGYHGGNHLHRRHGRGGHQQARAAGPGAAHPPRAQRDQCERLYRPRKGNGAA